MADEIKYIYKQIASNIEKTFVDRRDIKQHMINIIRSMVDLDRNSEDVLLILNGLLYKVYNFYNWSLNNWDIDEIRNVLIYEVNIFIENNYGDITTFVNSIDWEEGCVPYFWTINSTCQRFDTSNWNVCS